MIKTVMRDDCNRCSLACREQPTVKTGATVSEDGNDRLSCRKLATVSDSRGSAHLEPLRIACEMRTPSPDAVHVDSIFVDSQLTSQVRPVLVAEARRRRNVSVEKDATCGMRQVQHSIELTANDGVLS